MLALAAVPHHGIQLQVALAKPVVEAYRHQGYRAWQALVGGKENTRHVASGCDKCELAKGCAHLHIPHSAIHHV